MIARAECERLFRAAVAACDPARLVARAMPRTDRAVLAIAVGKAALAMARGAGEVSRGIAIAPALDGKPLPLGWRARDSAHPEPDARSVAAADAVIDVVRAAGDDDLVVALISGGASALIEKPRDGVTLEALRDEIREVMASGASIYEINARREELSALKGGKLARMCAAPIVTLAISDVVGDDIAVIGSGPTIAPERPGDRAEVIAKLSAFADAIALPRALDHAMTGEVVVVAEVLAGATGVAWGEPTLRVPADHGEGGRAQQLALELAKRIRGSERAAFVAGSDGQDGPRPRGRPAPAGAYVDGATWDAIVAAGVDPQRALARCDAGTALHAVGALFVTGPTGVNHADVAIVG
ncbi:MAG: DUF4147 domain-containing protein [Acidobacteriota bacterium]